MYDMNQIGVRIQAIRIRKNLTQEALAELINSDRAVISRIESGKRKCSLNYLVSIAEALEVTTDMLLSDDTFYKTSSQINLILSDCSIKELHIILDILSVLKESIRKYRI